MQHVNLATVEALQLRALGSLSNNLMTLEGMF